MVDLRVLAGRAAPALRRLRDERLLNLACGAEDELARMFDDERLYRLDHDVGFQFAPTAIARYKVTGDPEARRRGYLAAAFLMSRFNPIGGFIEAWNGDHYRGIVIIDTLIDLPLLFWAAAEFGQPRFRNAAAAHADLAIGKSSARTARPTTSSASTGERASPSRFWVGRDTAGFVLEPRSGLGPLRICPRRSLPRPPGLPRDGTSDCRPLPGGVTTGGAPPWDFRAPGSCQRRATARRGRSPPPAAGIRAAGSSGEGNRYRQAGVDLLCPLRACCSGKTRQEGMLFHANGDLPLARWSMFPLFMATYSLEALVCSTG